MGTDAGKTAEFPWERTSEVRNKNYSKKCQSLSAWNRRTQKKENLLQMILSFLGLYGVFTFGETHACLKLLGTFNICQTYCSHGLVTLRTFKHWVSLYLPTIS